MIFALIPLPSFRGLVYLALGHLKEAEADFKLALDANPNHAHFPHFRAVVHARKGELEMAVGGGDVTSGPLITSTPPLQRVSFADQIRA